MTGLAIDALADLIRRTPADELPLAGEVWTATVTDDEILLRITRAGKVNDTPVPRQPPKPKDPPKPKPPPKPRPKDHR